jgi:hypothetical protein
MEAMVKLGTVKSLMAGWTVVVPTSEVERLRKRTLVLDLTTIITLAAVATVISGGVALLASWRQRSHEARMEKLADARTLRDRKLERVWQGLVVVCEVALDPFDANTRLWMYQEKVLDEVDRVQMEADRKLDPARPSRLGRGAGREGSVPLPHPVQDRQKGTG